MRHQPSQGGQPAAEYLGIIVVVAVIVAALVTSPIGGQAAGGSSDLSCRILAEEALC